MLVTGRKIRAQSVVLVQHSGWGSWEAWNDWAGLRVLRRITSAFSRHYYDNRAITTPTTTRMATQASASRLRASARSRAFNGCDARHNPAAGTPNPVTASLMRRPSFASSGVALSTGERTRPPRGSPHTTSLGRGLSSYAHTKRNRRPARGRAACELPNAFPSIGTRATYRQLRPARYPQTRAVADKKTPPSSKELVDASFPITLTRRQGRRDATLPP